MINNIQNTNIRGPICCLLGHVDSGKTSLLDSLRYTNKHEKEPGNITQITDMYCYNLKSLTNHIKTNGISDILFIDTPGHEAFSRMRIRGSKMCDLGILVVDIKEGFQPQTFESIKLLKNNKIPFVVLATKIDRLYGWKSDKKISLIKLLELQDDLCIQEFNTCIEDIKYDLLKENFTSCLYYQNKNPKKHISIIPISSKTKDGLNDMISYIKNLVDKYLYKKLEWKEKTRGLILEIRKDKRGTKLIAILTQGSLEIGDHLYVCSDLGYRQVQIKSISSYSTKKQLTSVKASSGIELVVTCPEDVIAGTPLYKIDKSICETDSINIITEKLIKFRTELCDRLCKDKEGVLVIAQDVGSLESLVKYLRQEPCVPVFNFMIGVPKQFTIKKMSTVKNELYKIILSFCFKLPSDVRNLAKENGIHIIEDDVIYSLKTKYLEYKQKYIDNKKHEIEGLVNFPCKLKIIPKFIFNKKNPIIVGIKIEKGTLCIGTLIGSLQKSGVLKIGKVVSIENNNKSQLKAYKGDKVSIKIDSSITNITYGKHFDHMTPLISIMSRKDEDIINNCFIDNLNNEEIELMKKIVNICK
jgi:translation initiation factor 5B